MGLSSQGIGSNLDVSSIISQLMAVESRPLAALGKKEASYLTQVSAFGNLKGALGALQGALTSLSLPSTFQAVSATSSETGVASSTASSKAVAGTYAVDVLKLAQAQNLTTAGQASTTAAIGDGAKTTITFKFGTISGGVLTDGTYAADPLAVPPVAAATFTQDTEQAGGSIVIDSSNNSLQGIRDAINKAALGVTATIVSDGSATPNHLVLTSNKTGVTSSMKIEVAGDGGAAAPELEALLAHDPAGTQNLKQRTAAQNTELTVNGIAITSKTRRIEESIQGVTLNVNKIGSTTLTVARDTAAVETAIGGFVKAYNELDKTIKSLSGYNAETKTGGPLLGNSAVRSIQDQVRKVLGSGLPGASGALATLSQIGVAFQKDGTLALDSAKLKTAITNNYDELAGLFATTGTAADSLISFASSTGDTKPGKHPVNITVMATQGVLAGTAAPTSMTIVAGQNDKLTTTINGIEASLTLPAGTYTADTLAAQLQSTINGASQYAKSGNTVSVSHVGGVLSITSNKYGSVSTVELSGTAASNLFGGTVPPGVPGVDVAGTIDGVAAVGLGQSLTGAKGSPAEGLKLDVIGGLPGARGSVTTSRGYAYLLNKLVDEFTGSKGLISGQTDGLNKSIKDIGRSREALNDKLARVEERYRTQFTALDTMIGKMNTTSSFLAQQLAQISNMSSS